MELLQHTLKETGKIIQDIENSTEISEVLEHIIAQVVSCFGNGNKVMFCGNGGSAAEAQHLAAEL